MDPPASPQAKDPGAERSKPGRLFLRFLRSVALAYLIVALSACLFQRRLIYFPSSGPVPRPTGPRYEGIREVDLKTADGIGLKAWYWPGERPLVLCLFHGNAGNRGDRLEWMQRLRKTGAGIFIVDYRGYGGSGGSPSEEGLYLDAEAAAAWLAEQGAGPLVYVGESLGTAVAVELARRRPPQALVLQSPFTSLADVGSHHYWYLPVRLMVRDRFDVIGKIGEIKCPVLVIHGARDTIVPTSFGRKVFETAREPKEWLELPGLDHNDAHWDAPAYSARLKVFLGFSP